MRSSSYCESNCAPPLCSLPCLPKSKDDAGGDLASGSPTPAAVTEDKPPVVQKIEAVAAAPGGDGDDEKGCKEVAVASKSCLKRAGCVDSSKNVVKGNVKWKDLLGKDLTQVKEFEPSESVTRMTMNTPAPAPVSSNEARGLHCKFCEKTKAKTEEDCLSQPLVIVCRG